MKKNKKKFYICILHTVMSQIAVDLLRPT